MLGIKDSPKIPKKLPEIICASSLFTLLPGVPHKPTNYGRIRIHVGNLCQVPSAAQCQEFLTWKMPEAGAKGSHIHHRVQEAPRGRLGHAPSGEIAGSTSAARRELGCVARTRSGKCLHAELGAARAPLFPVEQGKPASLWSSVLICTPHFSFKLKALQTVYLEHLEHLSVDQRKGTRYYGEDEDRACG